MTTPRTNLNSESFRSLEALSRPLNDVLLDYGIRLSKLEAQADYVVDVKVKVGASLAVGTAPFPLRVATPQGFTPKGVKVVRVRNDSSTTVGTTAVFAWALPANGGGIELQFVTGLSVSTEYTLTLEISRG